MKDWKIVHRFEAVPDLPVLAEVDVLVIGGGLQVLQLRTLPDAWARTLG